MFTTKRIRVAEKLRVKVSRHFHYTSFGVRDRHDTGTMSGAFINSPYPGSGFFVHQSESRTYLTFVKEQKKLLQQSFGTLFWHKEPNFNKTIKSVKKVLDKGKSCPVCQQVLSAYYNVLPLAKDEEQMARYMRGLKNKVKKAPASKYHSSVLTLYKSRVATLYHSVEGTQLNIAQHLDEAQLQQWGKVVEAFSGLCSLRRVWHVVEKGDKTSYNQVFFDLGIFNYIQSPFDTPLMRDSQVNNHYLYPQGMICARSNTDFTFIPMNELDMETAVVDLNSLSPVSLNNTIKRNSAIGSLFATTTKDMTVGQLTFPKQGLTFYFNRVSPVQEFARLVQEFRSQCQVYSFGPLRPSTSDEPQTAPSKDSKGKKSK